MKEAKSDLNLVFRHGKRVALWLISLLVFLYLASGLFSVKPEQRGVVTRFGRVITDNVPPGIHYHWPWPIESVVLPRTTEIRSMAASFGADKDLQSGKAMTPQEKQIQTYAVKPKTPVSPEKIAIPQGEQPAPLLTGDENLVIATLLIQYTINQPKIYLYNTVDADGILKRITQQATIIMFAGMSVDEIFTTGRLVVQRRLKKEIQSTADAYELGILVVSVQIQTVQPPTKVAVAFRDVASAREDKHKLLQRGRGERNRRLPKARGEAEMMTSEAIAYANEVVEMAHGDAQRFLSAWEEYDKAKTVTAHRLYYEALEEIFPKVKKAIFNPRAERLPTIPRTQMSKESDLSE